MQTRLAIRPWRVDDAAALGAAIEQSLEHLRPWMPWVGTEPRPIQERRMTIATWERERRAGGDMVFGMFVGDTVVGGCGLHRRSGPRGLDIGYWVHADHTRQGFATRAAATLTSLAFTYPEIDHVEIHVDTANLASAGVPSNLGFVRSGQVPRPVLAPAETGVQDVWRMQRITWLREER